MTKKKVQLRSVRVFTDEFKKTCVKEYETGQFSVLELSQLYVIDRVILYRWIHKYSSYNKRRIRVVEMADSSKKRLKELQQRIQELERIVGQKQLNIDFLEKMIELAKEEYGVDIKKNLTTPRSTGSENTSNK
jgi:transposase-like protein